MSTQRPVDEISVARPGNPLTRGFLNRGAFRATLLVTCLLLFQGCLLIKTRPMGQGIGVTSDDLPQVVEIDGDKVYSLIQPDRIPAIDEPIHVPAAAADFMAAEELVLGVVLGGVAKAYSLWHLDRHEIVNDWLGEAPIAATW